MSPKRAIRCRVCGGKGHRKGNKLCKGSKSKGKEEEEEEDDEEKEDEDEDEKEDVAKEDEDEDEDKDEDEKKDEKRENEQKREREDGKKEEEEEEKEEEEDEPKVEDKIPVSVEAALLGDLLLCTDENHDFFACPVETVLREKGLEFSLASCAAIDDPREIFVSDPEDEADEFAESRFGYYICTVMFAHHVDDRLVHVHAMDPHVAASYVWCKEKELLPVRSFQAEMGYSWVVGDEVDVCRWEWQDNRQSVWCPAVICKVQEKEKGLYSVEYKRPIRFKTEEKIDDGAGWQYGEPKEIVVEENVFFTRLRTHLKEEKKRVIKKVARKVVQRKSGRKKLRSRK